MKIKLYSIAERKPPIGEDLMLYEMSMDGLHILEVKTTVQVELAICPDDELDLLSPDTVPDIIWNTGFDCLYSDIWSFAKASK